MSLLLAATVDTALVLAIALLAAALLFKSAASVRHAFLAAAIACALLMPALELLMPTVPVIQWGDGGVFSSGATLTSAAFLSVPAAAVSSQFDRAGMSWLQLFLAVWVAGAVVMAAGLITGLVRLRRLQARSAPVIGRWRELTDELCQDCGITRPVAVLQSEEPSWLITCGVFRPMIILPAGAAAWPDDRCRTVLRHELAHIRRHDAAVQLIGEVLRVAHWINPLVWLACRRLRQESEYACDDAVLNAGVQPTDYAAHLLDVARHLSGRPVVWPSAIAIAHPSTLERRIVAMLLCQRNRAPLGRRGWAFVALAALGISIPLAAAGLAPAAGPIELPSSASDVTPEGVAADDRAALSAPLPAASLPLRSPERARQATGTISGTIVDQTGGTMPGVRLTLTNVKTQAQVTMQTDASGQFTARELPPGAYELVARLPGFATVTNRVTLTAGANVQGSLTMPLGTVQETITVACGAPSAMVHSRLLYNAIFPAVFAQESPIRVGGNVRAPRKLTDVRPACPAAPAVETAVRVTGRIGVDGLMFDMVPAPTTAGAEPPKEYVDSVLEAVRQWVFTPTLLNGRAIEVHITVQVTFQRR